MVSWSFIWLNLQKYGNLTWVSHTVFSHWHKIQSKLKKKKKEYPLIIAHYKLQTQYHDILEKVFFTRKIHASAFHFK